MTELEEKTAKLKAAMAKVTAELDSLVERFEYTPAPTGPLDMPKPTTEGWTRVTDPSFYFPPAEDPRVVTRHQWVGHGLRVSVSFMRVGGTEGLSFIVEQTGLRKFLKMTVEKLEFALKAFELIVPHPAAYNLGVAIASHSERAGSVLFVMHKGKLVPSAVLR